MNVAAPVLCSLGRIEADSLASWNHLDRPYAQQRHQQIGRSPVLHDAARDDAVDVDTLDLDGLSGGPHAELFEKQIRTER